MFKKNRTALIVAAVLGIVVAPSAMAAPKGVLSDLCQRGGSPVQQHERLAFRMLRLPLAQLV